MINQQICSSAGKGSCQPTLLDTVGLHRIRRSPVVLLPACPVVARPAPGAILASAAGAEVIAGRQRKSGGARAHTITSTSRPSTTLNDVMHLLCLTDLLESLT